MSMFIRRCRLGEALIKCCQNFLVEIVILVNVVGQQASEHNLVDARVFKLANFLDNEIFGAGGRTLAQIAGSDESFGFSFVITSLWTVWRISAHSVERDFFEPYQPVSRTTFGAVELDPRADELTVVETRS